MADGLNQYEGLRTPPGFWPMIRFMQAAAHVDAGTPEPGFELIDEALTLAGTDGVLAPQFRIVRGICRCWVRVRILRLRRRRASARPRWRRASGPECPS